MKEDGRGAAAFIRSFGEGEGATLIGSERNWRGGGRAEVRLDCSWGRGLGPDVKGSGRPTLYANYKPLLASAIGREGRREKTPFSSN